MPWLLAALLVVPSFAGKRREKASPVPPEGFREMKVRGVVPLPAGAVIILGDTSDNVVHMMVGPTEGRTIFLRHERRDYERPLTHDLFDEILGFAQARIVDVRVDDVRSEVFVARVTVETRKRKQQTVDARASDSIAMALGRGLPIWFADHVVEKMAVDPSKAWIPNEDTPDEEEDAL